MDRTTAQSLIRYALVWDAHAGIFPSLESDLRYVGDWTDAGVDYVSINVGFDVMAWQETVATLSRYRRVLGAMEDCVVLVRGTADIDRARCESKLGVSFDIEGTNALNNDLGMVSVYHDLGVRQMLLAYNLGNSASGGCHDEDLPLTAFGRDVIAEMQRLGITVDLSHMSKRATLDAIEIATRPVVFSHSNPNTLWRHGRNIDDDQILACSETGGVIGINGMGIFLGRNDTSAEVFADHVCHVANLAGPEHVAFGLDWKPRMDPTPDIGALLRARPDYWPPGNAYDTPGLRLFSPTQLPDVVSILSDRGWTEMDILGFLGGNFRRVVEKTWN